MKPIFQAALASISIFLGAVSSSHAGPSDVVVENAWARASIGTSRPGVAYMEIRNTGEVAVTLTGIESEIAERPELHNATTDSAGISSMAPAGELAIGAGETVKLAPGGLHAMLMGLRRPMTEGDTFTLILLFADGQEVEVDVPILGMAASEPET